MFSKFGNRKVRGYFYQVVCLAFILSILGYAAYNTSVNLEKSGVASGFRFLTEKAGYPIDFNLTNYDQSKSTHIDAYYAGIVNTLVFTVITIIVTTILSFSLALSRLSSNWLLSKVSYTIVEYLRNIPMLLHIFIWFLISVKLPAPKSAFSIFDMMFVTNRGFFFPHVTAFGFSIVTFTLVSFILIILSHWAVKKYNREKQIWALNRILLIYSGAVLLGCIVAFFTGTLELSIPVLKGFNFKGGSKFPPELFTLVVAISVYSASHASEIIRGGILAVPRGMTEAAYALGAKPWLTQHAVIIPIAMKSIIPPMTSIYVNILKASALGVAVGFMGVMTTTGGSTLNITGQAVECIILVMAAYVVMNLILSYLMSLLNKYFNRLGEK